MTVHTLGICYPCIFHEFLAMSHKMSGGEQERENANQRNLYSLRG